MTDTYEKTLSVIKKINKDKAVSGFFESLLFGKLGQGENAVRCYNYKSDYFDDCAIYLNQNHIEVLTCIDRRTSGMRCYFSVKRLEMETISTEDQLNTTLQKQIYLILRENKEKFVLIFKSCRDRDQFKQSMEAVSEYLRQIPDKYDPLILKAFIRADSNHNDEISFEELLILMRVMKIESTNSEKDEIQTLIKKVLRKQNFSVIEFSEFENLWKVFYCRDELLEVFQRYNDEEFKSISDYLMPAMDIHEFQKFLLKEQGESKESIYNLCKKVYPNESFKLSFYDFCLFVLGTHNNLISQEYREKKINIDKPLNHYHCYSSHNTYLTGNQLTSDSRAERYFIDLQNGIRCVEIDLYDSSEGPIVKHGYTFTKSVMFVDVIKSIKKFTDLNPNHTPIILSLQVHCNEQNQQKMANIMEEHFTDKSKKIDKIVRVNFESSEYPSLKECQGMIAIKGPGSYKIYEQICGKNIASNRKSLQSPLKKREYQSQEHEQELALIEQALSRKREEFMKRIRVLKKEEQKFEDALNDFDMYKEDKLANRGEAQDATGTLLRVISILSKSKFENRDNCHWESISLNQNKILAHYESSQKKRNLIEMSKLKWFRSYPGGLRFNSSNYDPLPALEMGIQIIALNTQTEDDVNNHIMKSFFEKGKLSTPGYLDRLVEKSKEEMEQGDPTSISIEFISALRVYQNGDQTDYIPPVRIDAYFSGTERDKHSNKHALELKAYTKTIYNNAFNPKFNDSEVLHLECKDIEYAFLIVQIEACGRAVVPLESVKKGWRSIALYDEKLKPKETQILSYITVSHPKMNYKQ